MFSAQHIYHSAKSCNASPMDIDQIRKQNLLRLQGSRSQRECAELWDTSASTLSQITSKKAKRNLGKELARRIEQVENLPEGWLDNPSSELGASYVKEPSAPYAPKPESNAVMIGMMSAWDSDTPLHDDEVAIPFYKEVEMAAGSGATEVVEVPGRLLRFAKSTLRDAGVAEQNAACVQIRGNSMERLIMDGATVGIDRGTTQIIDGEMYAIDHDGMLRIKYLYRMPGGGLRIRSENSEEHPDEILSAEDAARIRVLGWVFWWSTVRRRRGIQR